MPDKTPIQIIPLCGVPTGHTVKIVQINGGKKLRQRLTDMGCLPGEEITVLEKDGPILISIKNSRLAIGRRMADSVLVTPPPDGPSKKNITVALIGTPDSGKTAIFDNLVEKNQFSTCYTNSSTKKINGYTCFKGHKIKFINLPSICELSYDSTPERIVRDFLSNTHPHLIINVIEASNLERNLYITIQLMELQIPILIVMTKIDLAQAKGYPVQTKYLSNLLNIPFFHTDSDKVKILENIVKTATAKEVFYPPINYGDEIEHELEKIGELIKNLPQITDYSARWIALKLLENDDDIKQKIFTDTQDNTLKESLKKSKKQLTSIFNDDPKTIIADRRYGFISGACSESLKKTVEQRRIISDKIDLVLLNPILGSIFFVVSIWLMFQFVFFSGSVCSSFLSVITNHLTELIAHNISDGILRSLIVDGLLSGISGILIFFPYAFILFLLISVFQDSGYLSRIMFLMDKQMHKVGLHGKSFLPVILGFGCTVPAIASTKTIPNKYDRLTTILTLPLISCGAKFPIYAILIGAFFPYRIAGNILFCIYFLGIILAIILTKLMRKYLFPEKSPEPIIELPLYRIPTIKSVLKHSFEYCWLYIRKVVGLVVLFSVLVWASLFFPQTDYKGHSNKKANEFVVFKPNINDSYAGKVAEFLSPIMKPIGFNRKISILLLSGIPSKELIIATLPILYSFSSTNLTQDIKESIKKDPDFTPLTAYLFIIFILISVPCIPVIIAIKKQTHSNLWAVFSISYTFALAWVICFVVNQIGLFFV